MFTMSCGKFTPVNLRSVCKKILILNLPNPFFVCPLFVLWETASGSYLPSLHHSDFIVSQTQNSKNMWLISLHHLQTAWEEPSHVLLHSQLSLVTVWSAMSFFSSPPFLSDSLKLLPWLTVNFRYLWKKSMIQMDFEKEKKKKKKDAHLIIQYECFWLGLCIYFIAFTFLGMQTQRNAGAAWYSGHCRKESPWQAAHSSQCSQNS